MNYDEFKQLCRKSWVEVLNYHCIDRSKKDRGRYCICNETKRHIEKLLLRQRLFDCHKCQFQLKTGKI